MTVESSAPSNIALIKYMGKVDAAENRPANSSLSWTMENLRSFVRLTKKGPQESDADDWSPLVGSDLLPMEMSDKSISRFLQHFRSLKQEFGVEAHFHIQSANNFPSDCGLASSASSFAALTRAAFEMFEKLGNEKVRDTSVIEQADLSRRGSGSSCRSFFGPWALWFQEGVRPLEFPMHGLLHQVIVVESGVKAVSSSEAHRRVTTSPLFPGRVERAERRLAELMELLRSGVEAKESWRKSYEIIWDEFMDMHSLFETSTPAFNYMTAQTHLVLKYFENLWQMRGDGPWVTMDAGANVHVLYRADQAQLAQEVREHWANTLKVFSTEPKK
jgi:diphosphomevalonate decarboxylase